jgi:crossover junction endodeoxyribonuclease RusA
VITHEFVVYGHPAPQGSKRAVGRRRNGSTIMIEMSKKVKPWRAAVAEAAMALGVPMIQNPVILCVVFTLKAPAKMPKGRIYPSIAPDLSKLVRSTEDGITTSGLWKDDALVVGTWAEKLYPGQVGALEAPGALITIHEIESVTNGQGASILEEWRSSQRSTKTPETG